MKSLSRLRYFCGRYGPHLRFVYAVCWALLFFRMAFDINERFFRVPLLLLSLPVLAGLPAGRISGAWRFLRRSPIVWGLLGLMVAAVLAATFSPFTDQPSYTHVVFGWFALTVAGFSAGVALQGKGLRILLFAGMAGLAASALWVGIGVWLDTIVLTDVVFSGSRLVLFTGYPATLGLMAGYYLVGYAWHMLNRRPIRPWGGNGRPADRLGSAALLPLLLGSQARTAFLAVAVTVWLLFVRIFRRPVRASCVFALVVVLLVGTVFSLGQIQSFSDSWVYQRVSRRIVGMVTDPLSDETLLNRMSIWETALESFRRYPVTGIGMRNFPRFYAEYMETDGERLRAAYRHVARSAAHAHNLALGVVTEMGLVGLFSLFLIYFGIFRARGLERGSDGDCLRMMAVYFLGQGCLDYMFSKVVYSDLFFGMAGLFLAAAFCAAREGTVDIVKCSNGPTSAGAR